VGIRLCVATVQDLIVSKLVWSLLCVLARQLEDVAALLRVAGTEIDRVYLHHWVEELGLLPQLEAAQRDATT
jgi:hypothetical protein